jgi:hypothetical protein
MYHMDYSIGISGDFLQAVDEAHQEFEQWSKEHPEATIHEVRSHMVADSDAVCATTKKKYTSFNLVIFTIYSE